MNSLIKNKPGISKFILQVFLLSGFLVTGVALAADKYRVSVEVFSLGELIAQPVMIVREDETTSGTYSVPGKAQYKFVILIRPAADGQVWASLQFTSGKIELQPNLLVDINKQTAVTIDKTRLTLLIEEELDADGTDQIRASKTDDP